MMQLQMCLLTVIIEPHTLVEFNILNDTDLQKNRNHYYKILSDQWASVIFIR